jgi:hypothetical protein
MRGFAFMLVVGCVQAPVDSELAGAQQATPAQMQLVPPHDALVRTKTIRYHLTGGPPSARVRLYGSLSDVGPASCPAPLQGCLDLVAPTATVHQTRTDASGEAVFDVFVPYDLQAPRAKLQAVTLGGGAQWTSQVFEARIMPPFGDIDLDGLSNGAEVSVYGTDPTLANTDGGGQLDGVEVLYDGTDPLDPNDDRVDSWEDFYAPPDTCVGAPTVGQGVFGTACVTDPGDPYAEIPSGPVELRTVQGTVIERVFPDADGFWEIEVGPGDYEVCDLGSYACDVVTLARGRQQCDLVAGYWYCRRL